MFRQCSSYIIATNVAFSVKISLNSNIYSCCMTKDYVNILRQKNCVLFCSVLLPILPHLLHKQLFPDMVN